MNMEPQKHRGHIAHSFDSFCKKIVKHRIFDWHRAARRQAAREVPFSSLSEREAAQLVVTDEYFSGGYIFDVSGESVDIADAGLAEALRGLPTDKRDIVLMSYFFDMTDGEIAERLDMARRTVAWHRATALKELRRHMESEEGR